MPTDDELILDILTNDDKLALKDFSATLNPGVYGLLYKI